MSCTSGNTAFTFGHDYLIRRINDWYIKPCEGVIIGTIKTNGRDYEIRIKAQILAWVDRHVVARVCSQKYAFVLGCINPDYKCKCTEYYQYLENLSHTVNFVI